MGVADLDARLKSNVNFFGRGDGDNSQRPAPSDVDQQLRRNAGSVFQQTVQFVKSSKPFESVSDSLKCKYKLLQPSSSAGKQKSDVTSGQPQSFREPLTALATIDDGRLALGTTAASSTTAGTAAAMLPRKLLMSGPVVPNDNTKTNYLSSTAQPATTTARPSSLDNCFNNAVPNVNATSSPLSPSSPSSADPPAWPTDGVPHPVRMVDMHLPIQMDWNANMGVTPVRVGLNNMGNTCFLNSVMQVLLNTAPLLHYVICHHKTEAKYHCKTAAAKGFCAICAFRQCVDLSRDVYKHNTNSFAPRSLINRLRLVMRSYVHGRQEDAHEFLRFLLDGMMNSRFVDFGNEKLDMFSKETNIISRIFGGFWLNTVKCYSCQAKSETYDPFLDICVELKANNLEDALRHMVRAEELSGANAYKCENCGRNVKASKRFTIHRAPNILTIQLKRFDHLGKINKVIAYKERLDLRPYMSPSLASAGASVIYKLYGVVVHHGFTTHSGHYLAYIRHNGDHWLQADDGKVSAVSRQHALNQSAAYMLFYARQSPPVAHVGPQQRVNKVLTGGAGLTPTSAPTNAVARKSLPANIAGKGPPTHRVPPLVNKPTASFNKLIGVVDKQQQLLVRPKRPATDNDDAAAGRTLKVARTEAAAAKSLVPYEDDDESDRESSLVQPPIAVKPIKMKFLRKENNSYVCEAGDKKKSKSRSPPEETEKEVSEKKPAGSVSPARSNSTVSVHDTGSSTEPKKKKKKKKKKKHRKQDSEDEDRSSTPVKEEVREKKSSPPTLYERIAQSVGSSVKPESAKTETRGDEDRDRKRSKRRSDSPIENQKSRSDSPLPASASQSDKHNGHKQAATEHHDERPHHDRHHETHHHSSHSKRSSDSPPPKRHDRRSESPLARQQNVRRGSTDDVWTHKRGTYGANVSSWSGGASTLDQLAERRQQRSPSYSVASEPPEQQQQRGRKRRSSPASYNGGGANPFQAVQDERNAGKHGGFDQRNRPLDYASKRRHHSNGHSGRQSSWHQQNDKYRRHSFKQT